MVRTPIRLRRARGSVFAAFLVHAAALGTWAPRIPAIKQNLHLDHGEIGLALTWMAAGFLVGTRLAGPVARRFGTGAATRVGAVLLCGALVSPSLAGGLGSLAAALGLLGVAGGFVDVAMNTQAVLVERRYGRPIMSGFHALWSLGAMGSAVVAGVVAGAGVGVRVHFAVSAVVLGAVAIVSLRGLLPVEEEQGVQAERGGGDPGARRRRLVATATVALGVIGFCSLVGEGSAFDWSAVYLRENLGTGPGVAASGLAAFSVAMAMVRLAGDRLSARFGPVAVIRTGGTVAAVGMGLLIAAQGAALGVAGFALVGAGLGPVVPSTFSAAGNTPVGPTTTALGGVLTASYLGSIIGPLTIGFAADVVGLRAALAIPAVLALVIVAAAPALRPEAGPTGPD